MIGFKTGQADLDKLISRLNTVLNDFETRIRRAEKRGGLVTGGRSPDDGQSLTLLWEKVRAVEKQLTEGN